MFFSSSPSLSTPLLLLSPPLPPPALTPSCSSIAWQFTNVYFVASFSNKRAIDNLNNMYFGGRAYLY